MPNKPYTWGDSACVVEPAVDRAPGYDAVPLEPRRRISRALLWLYRPDVKIQASTFADPVKMPGALTGM